MSGEDDDRKGKSKLNPEERAERRRRRKAQRASERATGDANPATGDGAAAGAGDDAAAGDESTTVAGHQVSKVATSVSSVPETQRSTVSLRAGADPNQAARPARTWRWALLAVGVVTLVGWVYWALWASPRYTANASFTIRAEREVDAAGVLGAFGFDAGKDDDNRIAIAYVQGRQMLAWLDDEVALRDHYQDERWDRWSRLAEDASSEDYLAYAQDRIHAALDQTSGLVQLRVEAFTPEAAEAICAAMLRRGEEVVNELGHQPIRQRLAFLEEEVAHQQARLEEAKAELLAFQATHGVIDPTAEVMAGAQAIAALQARLAQERAALAELRVTQGERSLAVRQAEARIAGVEDQIVLERARLITADGDDDEGVTDLAADYGSLQLTVALRVETHRAALLAYQQARADLGHKLKHLLVIEPPAVTDDPSHPRVWYNTLTLGVISMMLAATAVLIGGVVTEHRD